MKENIRYFLHRPFPPSAAVLSSFKIVDSLAVRSFAYRIRRRFPRYRASASLTTIGIENFGAMRPFLRRGDVRVHGGLGGGLWIAVPDSGLGPSPRCSPSKSSALHRQLQGAFRLDAERPSREFLWIIARDRLGLPFHLKYFRKPP